MAATQTEKQQNDLNSSEKAQPDQHLNLRNTLMQNGTEKNNVRGNSVVVAKSKVSGTKNLGLEMSQYRQDSVSGSCPASDQALNNAAGLETELNQASDINSYPPVSDDASSAPDANTVHGYNFPFGNRSSYNPTTEQHAPSPSGPTESNLLQNFGQFGPQGIRHGFPGSKQPMIGPRPPGSSASGAFPQQQTRFMSGQSISQPTGPTPTLNQLLQSTNQIRYQNNYGHADHTPYGPTWQTQKPLSSYSPSSVSTSSTVYRTQNTLSSSYSGAPPSSPSSYGQNDQQPGQGQGSAGQQQQQQQASRQAWNTSSSNQHPPSSPGQSGLPPGSRQSPQPGGHSPGPGPGPGPGMPPSPQQAPTSSQQTSQLQSQSFPNRPAQPTTPNAHAPDTGDLTGQNSNDSSGGPAPGTPNSQGMRPTPSPTGSTGSRSLSPAVGQQNIPMPPRPSSSQSDGSGPTRMSHSPMSAQGNYQQHLGPSMHVHGYKMPNHPGMIPSGTVVPGQVPIYNQQYSQASPGAYQSRSQQYGPNPNQYGPVGNTVTQQSTAVGNNMSPGSQPGPTGPTPTPAQYAGRPIPNHVPHSQFSSYQQNWTPGVNQVGQTTTSSLGGGANAGASPNAASPRPPQYLKQHLQHKIGFGNTSNMPPSPGPPQNYAPGMGPPIHQHNMGPPTSGHHHSGMGPPTSGPANMGPPNMAPPASSSSALTANTITTSTNQIMSNNLHQHPHDGPMPPPSSTPNSHVGSTLTQAPPVISMHGDSDMLDNNAATTVASVTGGSVTSVVTTGPDGTTLDEGSQQSTLSNASAASGEDPQCTTPKSRKNEMSGAGHYSHPATPQSTVPSPGAASMNSMHEEYELNNSPSWPRTPASPVFNSHVAPPDTYRSKIPKETKQQPDKRTKKKKTDSLGKLYEMDDSPDRRVWLDKLLAFMEERRTPITTCPTISKNPLDLFRLYVYVKERGGFMEVTKNKTWKDIAGMLGIGASSSAAYTLRKHYTKNLLAYECQFDRGGIDPQPIINQVEANSKKKSAKAASVPSPGSSNSQDSFPAPGSSGASMDGYGNFGYTPGPGSGSTSDYNSPPMQRPSSQSNAPSPHAGAGVTNHHGGAAAGGPSPAAGAADNINVSNPFDDVSPSPPPRPPAGTQYTPGPHPPYGQSGPPRPQGMQQNYGVQSGYNQYSGSGPGTSTDQYQSYSSNSGYPPATRPMYPPYGPEGDRTYTQTSSNMTTSTSTVPTTQSTAAGGGGGGAGGGGNGSVTSQDPYNRYAMNSNQVGNYAPPRPAYCSPSGPAAGSPTPQPPAGSYTGQQEYYRSDQAYASQQQGPPPPVVSGPPNQMYPNGPPNKAMPPPTPQPKRHPDFAKDQQQAYAPYGQQRPQLYGWPNNNQYRGQYQSPNSGTTTTPQWNQGTNRSAGPPHNSQAVNNQWEHRYPPNNTQNNYQGGAGVGPVPVPVQQNQQWSSIATPGIGQSSPLRPPLGSRSTFRSDGKPFNLNQGPNIKANQSGTMTSSSYPQQPLLKREISFPPDSIEATLPVLYRRKRICRMDLNNVDAWRVMMCLRSGLLSETTYALDMLNILLFDDSTVPYFGLSQWPGLLDLLLEHFRKSLVDMFDNSTLDEPDRDWYMHNDADDNTDQQQQTAVHVDLGAVDNDDIDADNKTVLLTKTPNYTHTSRKDQVIRQVERNEDIFIRDNHKCWDVDGDAAGVSAAKATTVDSWQLASIEAAPTKYILPCFQAEFNNIPFCKFISDEKKCKTESTSASSASSARNKCDATKTEVNTDDYSNSSSELVNVIETQLHSDKKKRTNTLSDVISRIKKDSSQINLLLTQELKEKVKTDSNGLKINEIMPEDIDLSPKTTQNGSSTNYKMKTELDSEEDTTNGSVSGSGYSNEGPSASAHASTPTTTSTSSTTRTTTTTATTNTGATSATGTTSSNNNNNNAVNLKLNIKDTAGTLKRRRMSDYEDECYTKDEASLCLLTDTQDSIAKRCVAISNILRNLTFIPGNEGEFAKNAMFLSLLGKLLLLYHEHPVRTQKIRNYDREEDADFVDSCSSLQGEYEWWWEFLVHIRENVLVSLANIAGHMDLSQYAEDVARPVLDGLLHWAICPSAHGQDPFPNVGTTSLLSPQRLALEALCKLCVTDSNVDLVIATPPFSRLERLCAVLTKHLCRSEDQVLREFSVNLLHYLAAADSTMARVVATQNPCVSLLVAFIEQAEQSALGVANQHGIGALRENPDSMGTSLDMLRRAAGTLLYLAKHPDNRPLFMQQEQRLLQLVMSQILDQQVAFVIARVLFHISRTNENNSTSTNS